MEQERIRMKKKKLDKSRRVGKKKESSREAWKSGLTKFGIRFLVTAVLTLLALIGLKGNSKFKTEFYKQVYDTNFSFATLNNTYQKYFGSPIPFQDLLKQQVETVFDEKLTYQEVNLYKDGAKLTVSKNYLVPILESGMVVFIGKKEGYGNTVIIQGMNGIDTWYGNILNVNVKLYDYVSKGTLLGEVKDTTLYMIFEKEGKKLNYKDYLK